MHFLRFEFAFAGFFAQFAQFDADLFEAFFVHVFNHGHHQTIGSIGGKADVEVFFQHQIVAIQRGIEFGELLQSFHAGLDDKGQGRHFNAFALPFFVELFAEFFQIGHVGIKLMRYMRNHHPVACQILAGNLLDAGALFDFDFTEFGKIHFRPRQQVQPAAQRSGGGTGAGTFLHHALHKGFNVFAGDAAFTAGAGYLA